MKIMATFLTKNSLIVLLLFQAQHNQKILCLQGAHFPLHCYLTKVINQSITREKLIKKNVDLQH